MGGKDIWMGLLNPRRACAAIVVPCVCVSECFRGPHLQPTQLSDKVGILAVSVSCSLVFKKGVFRIYNGFVSKIAVAFPYLRAHGSRPFCMRNGLIFRIPSVYYARDCTRAVNLYAHV